MSCCKVSEQLEIIVIGTGNIFRSNHSHRRSHKHNNNMGGGGVFADKGGIPRGVGVAVLSM